MSEESDQFESAAPEPHSRRGALDPILSNRDGLFSALEERTRAKRTKAGGGEWAHRHGEPRLLVLCWAVYLLAASGATIMRLPRIGFADPRFVQSSARLLILLIAVGLTVLWPMVRLSQASPRKPMTAALVDLVALLAPLAAVLWPVTWLGRWDWRVTAAVLALLAAWGFLLSAVIAVGTRGGSALGRIGWAAVCAMVVVLGPTIALILSGTGADAWPLFYASPLTGVFALTTEASGRVPTMMAVEWWSSAGPLAGGMVVWAVAVVFRGHSPSRA